MQVKYDAVLVIGFGGPEHRDDVIPFLENVLRGRNVPRERMLAVAEHYYHFDGISPINGQVRELITALRPELDRRELDLPIYWGNRNWHPLLADSVGKMQSDGISRAIGLVLAGYSSYSSCRQYRENVQEACHAIDGLPPAIDKIRVFYNHPLFVDAIVARLTASIGELPESQREQFHVAFTAHSIPQSMADGCLYESQLTETCRLVAEQLQISPERWQLVYQSRSGRPTDPWLEPDICDHLRVLKGNAVGSVIISPVGFLSDHMEVLFDLDEEARQTCDEIGLTMVRSPSVGIHPAFVEMLGELIEERARDLPQRRAIGRYEASHDVCPVDCCPAPVRPPVRPAAR